MSRRGARRNAFYLLFQMDFSEAEEFEQVKELFFTEKEEPVEEEDKEFILSAVEGVHAHMAEIDEMITASANGWDPARMNKVDLAILRLAVYEMKYGETPIGVAIGAVTPAEIALSIAAQCIACRAARRDPPSP